MRLFAGNQARTTLTQPLSATDTEAHCEDLSRFPDQVPFLVTIGLEIIRVHSIDKAAKKLGGLVRGIEGTSPAAHPIGTRVENRFTAGTLDSLYAESEKSWVKFHPTTGHRHSGTGTDAPNIPWGNVSDKPSTFPPAPHKATHATGGTDPLTPADIGAETPSGAQAKVDTHAALTSAHGATSAATANRIILRDAAGRAKVTAPEASDDIARKAEIDAHADLTSAHGATAAATANRIILRDAAGRAKVASPTASDDIATKGYVDSVSGDISGHVNATQVHGATPDPTPERIIIRDAGGRAKVAAPVASNDIARKAEVDAHAELTSAHGATSDATANRIILRDSAGRAKIAAPVASDDIARKAEVDSVSGSLSTHIAATAVHGATSSAVADRIIIRDAAGRAKVAAPAASDDIARRAEIDAHAALTSAHGATVAATADRIVLRDSAGRAKVATPTAADDIATKDYVDTRFHRAGIAFTIDGGGAVITTGSKGYIEVPFACTVTGWTILSDVVGSIVVDVRRSTYAGFPTTTSIAGTEKPTLTNARKNQDLDLTTWTTALALGDILEFVVESVSAVRRVNIGLRVVR